jgi:ribosome biogenesis GTPase / thiamine phosphate phosphatase
VPLAGGAVLIDTPGLRSVAVWDPGVEEAFADVAEIAGECRFADCTHEHEPGCAMRRALDDGRLDAARWESYRRLRAEQEALEARRRGRPGARRRA